MITVPFSSTNWKGALAGAVSASGDLPKKIPGMCVFVFSTFQAPRYGEIAAAVDELFPDLQIGALSICRSVSTKQEVSVIINKGSTDGV